MNVFGSDEHFSRAAPAGDQPSGARSLLEIRDVLFDLQRQLVFVLGFLDVSAVQPLYVLLVKRSFHRLDLGEERFDLEQVFFAQHSGVRSGFVSVILENIPAAENQVIKTGKWYELFDLRRIIIGALTEANRTQLR